MQDIEQSGSYCYMLVLASFGWEAIGYGIHDMTTVQKCAILLWFISPF